MPKDSRHSLGPLKDERKGPVYMGFQVPSPTHVSKAQYGGNIPSFKPQETIKTWLIIINVGSWLFMLRHLQNLCWELGLASCSTQHKPQVSLPKSYAMHASMFILHIWGPVWSGKPQLPCSQWLEVHKLTSSSLGHWTQDPCEQALRETLTFSLIS